jgi:hypothetical protein
MGITMGLQNITKLLFHNVNVKIAETAGVS